MRRWLGEFIRISQAWTEVVVVVVVAAETGGSARVDCGSGSLLASASFV
jgi:hypothetical protein